LGALWVKNSIYLTNPLVGEGICLTAIFWSFSCKCQQVLRNYFTFGSLRKHIPFAVIRKPKEIFITKVEILC